MTYKNEENTVLLNNGYEIPMLGFGTHPNKENLIEIIPNALHIQGGYRMFDTSDNYHNEKFLGEALKTKFDEFGRENLFLITKFSAGTSASKFASVFKTSLENLFPNRENESIDIYLMHWPYPFLYRSIWKKMEEKYLAGECKAIGVCNFEVKHLQKLMKNCRIKPMLNQIECHPFFRQAEICSYCEEHQIQIMSYSPLARMNENLMNCSELEKLAGKYKKTVGQIILRWDFQHKYITLASSKSAAHMKLNRDIFDFCLTEDEMKVIDSLDCGMRIRFDPNKRFTLKQKVLFFRERILIFFKLLFNVK